MKELLLVNSVLYIIGFLELLNKKLLKRVYILLLTGYFILIRKLIGEKIPDLPYYKLSYDRGMTAIKDLRLEFFYRKINIFFHSLGVPFEIYHYLLFIIIIIIFIKIANSHMEGYHLIPAILFLSYYGLYYTHVLLRIGLATSIFLYFYLLKCKNKLKYILPLVMSFYFHKSIVIYILIYFIPKKKFKTKNYLTLLFVSLFIYYTSLTKYLFFNLIKLLLRYDFFKMYRVYIYTGQVYSKHYSSKYLLWFFMGILFVYFFRERKEKKISYILNIYITGLMLFSCFGFFLYAERITDFFFIFQYLLVYLLIMKNPKLKERLIFYCLFYPLFLLNTIALSRFIRIY